MRAASHRRVRGAAEPSPHLVVLVVAALEAVGVPGHAAKLVVDGDLVVEVVPAGVQGGQDRDFMVLAA
jgi:hypothetical protein